MDSNQRRRTPADLQVGDGTTRDPCPLNYIIFSIRCRNWSGSLDSWSLWWSRHSGRGGRLTIAPVSGSAFVGAAPTIRAWRRAILAAALPNCCPRWPMRLSRPCRDGRTQHVTGRLRHLDDGWWLGIGKRSPRSGRRLRHCPAQHPVIAAPCDAEFPIDSPRRSIGAAEIVSISFDVDCGCRASRRPMLRTINPMPGFDRSASIVNDSVVDRARRSGFVSAC